MISLIEQELVQRHSGLNASDFMDAVAGAQFLPGAIAVNVALFTGHRSSGAVGALTATIGSCAAFISGDLCHYAPSVGSPTADGTSFPPGATL